MTDPAATPGPAADEGPARQNEIAETLSAPEARYLQRGGANREGLPLYFNSVSLLEELEARVEDARLYMQGQERTAIGPLGRGSGSLGGSAPSGPSRCGQPALPPGRSSPRQRWTL